MLTIATLGMAGYGVYAVFTGMAALFGAGPFRPWISIGFVFFGTLLILAGLLVRVVLPGSLQLAIGALLGLQALALSHIFYTDDSIEVVVLTETARAIFAVVLVAIAWLGSRGAAPGRG